jgi:hypothetical protein
VDAIEAKIREKVKFAYDGGRFRMLIATICLEHFTAMMADLMMDLETDYGQLFSKTDPALERLWRWHAMEETEHKAVAYDVFLEATKDMVAAEALLSPLHVHADHHQQFHEQYRRICRRTAESRWLHAGRGRPRREGLPLEEAVAVRHQAGRPGSPGSNRASTRGTTTTAKRWQPGKKSSRPFRRSNPPRRDEQSVT